MEKQLSEKGSTDVLRTHDFRITFGSINRVAVNHLASRWWWVVVLPLTVFAVMGIYVDERWIFLIPISSCLIFPFFGVMAFVAQTSTPRLAQSTRLHYAEISGEWIRLVPVPDEITPDNRMPYMIYADEIADTSVAGHNFVVYLRGGSFLLIPRDSTDDELALADAIDALVQ
ncbi:MAG: hypothetical protein K2I57_09485 [Muribaculaceae bacterium]|nr:hypothetical protein [Muribaculaceae bacterium]